MAEATLTGELRPVTPTSRAGVTDHAYAAWKRVEAEWELARHQPENVGTDLPDELDAMFCSRSSEAREAYFLMPSEDLRALYLKLSAYCSDQAYHGGDTDGELIGAILLDARTLFNKETGRG